MKVNLYYWLILPYYGNNTQPMIFVDIDECDIGAHNCRSDNWQICNNTEGSFECVCERGFNFIVEGNCEGILLPFMFPKYL